MADRDLTGSLKVLYDGMTPMRRIVFALLVGGTLAGLLYLIFWANSPIYSPLYTNLPPEDAGMVIEKLKAENIPYRVSGDTISVPRDVVFETTMMLASENLPRGGGVGFEIFDQTKLGMTEFEQTVNYQRALQGELSRTISRFSEVRAARVHIVMPTQSLFVESEKPASASVILSLMPGATLTKGQVQGISHLLTHAVPGLSHEQVTIVDDAGNILAGRDPEPEREELDAVSLNLQHRIERKIEMRVRSMLEEVLGIGKSIVRVSAELDFNRQEMTEEKFAPETVVRSEQIADTTSSGPVFNAEGVPGVMSNMTQQGMGAGGDADAAFNKREKTANYEISKMVRRVVNPIGAIKRLSVAVIVDGNYRPVAPAPPAPGDTGVAEDEADAAAEEEDKEPEKEYVPRTTEEMEKLARIVRGAINYSAERGDIVEVVNLPFESEIGDGEAEEPAIIGWWESFQVFMPLIRYLFAGMVIFLTFFLVIRPLVKWLTAKPALDGQLLKQLPMTVGEMEKEYAEGGRGAIGDQLNQTILGDKDRSAEVLRKWLKESAG